MTGLSLIRETSLALECTAALDQHAQPVALWIESDAFPARARYEDRLRAITRKRAPQQGGAFLELETGEAAFLRISGAQLPHEGERLTVRIAAEARRDKLARVTRVETDTPPQDAFSHWLTTLPGGPQLPITHAAIGNAEISSALDAALATSHTLPGGGIMWISRTPALTAVDIDTAGRSDTGRAYDRARAVNLAAARTLGRLLNLQCLGGLAVLDCVAPLHKAGGGDVRAAFLAAHQACSTVKAACLAPSPFGLMQVKRPWTVMPIADLLLTPSGEMRPEAAFALALRDAEREAAAQPMRHVRLGLPPVLHRFFTETQREWAARIDAAYRGRISVTRTEATTHTLDIE